ncbi:MAG: hypothetical protein IT185_01890 [Acidobacteria bacterium]|nr:hypothetical protein [Acidobacteriota bacterium]
MRLSRALIVALALVVSPVGASVCEVVCGVPSSPAVASAPTSVDDHAHHGHHAAPSPAATIVRAATPDEVAMSIPAADCDIRTTVPARLRTPFTDIVASSAALTSSVYGLDLAAVQHQRVTGVTPRPPISPPHTLVPLRI